MTKTTTRISGFTIFLLILSAVLTAALSIGLWFLWTFLEDYQATLPQTVAAPYIKALKEADGAKVAPLCGKLPAALASSDSLSGYLKKRCDGHKIESYSDASYESQRPVYAVAADGEPFAAVTLKMTGEQSRFGFDLFEVDSVRLHSDRVYTIIAPKGVEPLADGEPLPSEYQRASHKMESFAALGEKAPEMITCSSTGFAYLVEVTAQSPWGGTVQAQWDKEGQKVQVICVPQETTATQLREFALGFVRDYVHFASEREAPREGLLGRLYPGTVFLRQLWGYDNSWGMVSQNERYENEKAEQLCQYSPSEFSCEVTMDYVVTYRGREQKLPVAFRCYITATENGLRITDMQSI